MTRHGLSLGIAVLMVACTSPSSVAATPSATMATTPPPLVTQSSMQIALVSDDLPESLGYLVTSDASGGCATQSDCSARRVSSLYSPSGFARVEVFVDVAAAKQRFTDLAETAQTQTPGLVRGVPLQGWGDESATFIKASSDLTVATVQLYLRAANTVHFVGLVGTLQMSTEYAVYLLGVQLTHLTAGVLPTPLSPPDPLDPRHPLGYVAAFPNGWGVGVLSWAEQPPSRFAQPSIGNRFVAVTVTAMNGSTSGNESLNFVSFWLIGSDRQWRIGSTATGVLGGMGDVSLGPGSSKVDTIVFEVPVGQNRFTIVYKAGLVRNPAGYPAIAWVTQ